MAISDEETRAYRNEIINVLHDIRDNVFSLNKKFEVYATLKDPDFENQVHKLLQMDSSKEKKVPE